LHLCIRKNNRSKKKESDLIGASHKKRGEGRLQSIYFETRRRGKKKRSASAVSSKAMPGQKKEEPAQTRLREKPGGKRNPRNLVNIKGKRKRRRRKCPDFSGHSRCQHS